jgi:hypothetical protein
VTKRRRWLAAVGAGGLVVLSVLVGRPLIGVAAGYTDVGSLPELIRTCGREWRRTNGPQVWPSSKVPQILVIEPGPFGITPCPWSEEVRTAAPTAVFVRVGDDAYAVFELAGGP